MKNPNIRNHRIIIFSFVLAILSPLAYVPALADTAAEIDAEVAIAKQQFLTKSPEAKELSKTAKGMLIFPDVVKAGLIIGGQYDEGALLVDGKTVGYYSSVAASYGLQACAIFCLSHVSNE